MSINTLYLDGWMMDYLALYIYIYWLVDRSTKYICEEPDPSTIL